MLLVMITTTALINAILLLCMQIQLKYTVVSKVTSERKIMRGKKKLRSDNDRGITSAVTGKFSDPPVIMTGITSRFISRPADVTIA